MAVTKLKNGKWKAKISYRGGNNQVMSKEKRFSTRREALDFETDFRRLNSHADETLTYGTIVEMYLEWNKASANDRTLKDKRFLITKFTSHLSNRKYSLIKKSEYQKISRSILAEDWSVVRKNRALMIIKSIATYAYNHHDLENRTRHLEQFRKTSDDVDPMRVWSVEDLTNFLDHVEEYTMRTLFSFQFYTGARIGEARALQKSDLNNNQVSFNKSIRSYSEGFKPLKNVSSRRVIALDNNSLRMLQPLISTPGDFLFGDYEPLGMSTIQRVFERAIKASGVPKIRIHDLRHSHATILINNGANIVAVSKRLGHADIQTTLRSYTHLLKETEDKLMDIINEHTL